MEQVNYGFETRARPYGPTGYPETVQQSGFLN